MATGSGYAIENGISSSTLENMVNLDVPTVAGVHLRNRVITAMNLQL